MSAIRQRAVDITKLSGAGFLSGRKKREGFSGFVRSNVGNADPLASRLEEAQQLINNGASPDRLIKVGWQPFRTTPLFEAAIVGDHALAAVLLQGKADPNLVVGPGFTALYEAAMNGHTAVVQLLIKHGASVDTITDEGFSPLYIASQNGHSESLEAILAAADMSAMVANCCPEIIHAATALHVACQQGHPSLVKRLVAFRGLLLDPRMTTDGSTPLMIALYLAVRSYSWQHAEVAAHLVAGGASLSSVQDDRGRTALEWAPEAWREALEACARGELSAEELMTMLKQQGDNASKHERKKAGRGEVMGVYPITSTSPTF